MKCQLCGLEHEFKCSLIKAYEYHPDGKVSRVEFVTFADFQQQQPPSLLALPAHSTRQ
jgi:hypothetical protein